ncbi:hypothetical protein Pyn_20193 [Prunus yedoensis var. nudiflora]|uniref:Uncharacterized protein n=1 Tax=Prunus yedoensis var. nudiflora TaxID=2094558 RepID=A0A314YMR3_PRUYE|nr:hypothetical protein Pyn_20193 [Prunus yedoensis var. nudiflora]
MRPPTRERGRQKGRVEGSQKRQLKEDKKKELFVKKRRASFGGKENDAAVPNLENQEAAKVSLEEQMQLNADDLNSGGFSLLDFLSKK